MVSPNISHSFCSVGLIFRKSISPPVFWLGTEETKRNTARQAKQYDTRTRYRKLTQRTQKMFNLKNRTKAKSKPNRHLDLTTAVLSAS